MGVFDNIAARPGYFAAVGVASIGIGVGIYFLSGKIAELVKEKSAGQDDGAEYAEADIQDGAQGEKPHEVVYEKTISEEFVKPPIIDYTSFSRKGDEAAEEPAANGPEIEIITVNEYMDASGEYGKADGTYFTSDKVLAGWNERLDKKVVEDTVGTEAVEAFDDPDVKAVYVRNKTIMVDFEIVRSDVPYEEALQEASLE